MSLIFAGVSGSSVLGMVNYFEDKYGPSERSRLFQLLVADCCAHIILTGGHAVVSWVRAVVQLAAASARAR